MFRVGLSQIILCILKTHQTLFFLFFKYFIFLRIDTIRPMDCFLCFSAPHFNALYNIFWWTYRYINLKQVIMLFK